MRRLEIIIVKSVCSWLLRPRYNWPRSKKRMWSRQESRLGQNCRVQSLERSLLSGGRQRGGIVHHGETIGSQVTFHILQTGVAGAVLQTPPSLILSFIQWSFSSKSLRHLHFQTVLAQDLQFWENAHLPQMSHVSVTCKCHVSCMTCQM